MIQSYNDQKKHMKIMKELKIKKHKEVYWKYNTNDHEFLQFISNRKINKLDIQQYGGNKKDKIKYKFDNKEFIIYKKKVEGGYDFAIHRKDNDENQTCLHIMINTKYKLAYIQNISYYQDCLQVGLNNSGGGSMLLKMAIQFLKDNKEEYKVRRIQLTDNSYFNCKSIKKTMFLPIISTLTYGTTWYGKYGFRPYDSKNNCEHEEWARKFDRNKEIVTGTKVKNTNLFKYILKGLKKLNPGNEDKQKKIVNEFYDNKKYMTVDEFFKDFLDNFQKSCGIVYLFYLDYFTDLKLFDFTGKSFYLDI